MEATRAYSLCFAAILFAAAHAACGSAEEEGPQLIMRAPRTVFWSAPFPSDDLRGADGSIDVHEFPNPDALDLVRHGVEMIATNADGFATSGGIFFPLTGPLTGPLTDGGRALAEHVVVMPLEGGARHPIEARFYADARPYGPMNLLAVLPVQGIPLKASTTYVAAVLKSAGLATPGDRFDASALKNTGLDEDEVAGLTVFTTGDPTRELKNAAESIDLQALPSFEGDFVWRETHDDFCVYSSTIAVPIVFTGAASAPSERARVFVTLPRSAMPAGGYPLLVFSRTGGGGDRPLIDRGRRASNGGEAIAPGTGPAMELARIGFAGLSIDGPHGGPFRNPNNQDEQFLVFNFLEPPALRDNVLQSAFELILAARLLDAIHIQPDEAHCPGVQVSERTRFDLEKVALMGHSMGATIAPLTAAFEPRYRAMVLSGAGGSWIENLVHKEKPIAVRPLAEQLLGYPARGRTLDSFDPVLTIVQWAIEPADPQVYAAVVAARADRHILMLQGIVDHYIMPPIANALSLALGLDLAGPSLDRETAETARFASLESLLPLIGRGNVGFPVEANQDRSTRLVVQNAEDGIEDGHEVVFQTDAPKALYRCFLESFARGTPKVPAPNAGSCP